MAIDYAALFTKIGRIGHLAYLVNQHSAALPAALESLFVEYDATTPPGYRDAVAPLEAAARGIVAYPGTWLPALVQPATDTLLGLVNTDAGATAGSVEDALRELVRQMTIDGESVKRSTVSATASALTGMQGTGQAVVSNVRPDGLTNELLLPEVGRLACTADSYRDGRTAGNEIFTYAGEVGDPADVWAYDWPAGTGVRTGYTAISPDSGSLLANGGFEDFTTANVPDQWVIEVGTAGTNVLQDTSVYYTGTSALQIRGGATQIAVSQTFNDSTNGTGDEPSALTPYGVSLWLYVDVVPAAGVLTVELVDGSGTVVNDANGTANSFTVSVPGLTGTTWTAKQGVFRLPKAVPSTLKVRLRLSTAMSSGSHLTIDNVTFGELAAPYEGGPLIGVFAGATAFARDDAWTVDASNNRGGASYNATFHALFDRLFGMRALGLQLPSASGPSQADTLITS